MEFQGWVLIKLNLLEIYLKKKTDVTNSDSLTMNGNLYTFVSKSP